MARPQAWLFSGHGYFPSLSGIRNFALVWLALTSTGAAAEPISAAPAKPPPAPSSCDTPGHRQFDFWVGRWNVYRSDTNQYVADSLIEKLYDGCAIRENWMPLHGHGGGSLNAFRPASNEWRQVWTDAKNGLNEYSGHRDDAKMEMSGTAASATGERTPVRMTFEPLADGSVIQTGYESADQGKSWKLRYRFVYRRARQP